MNQEERIITGLQLIKFKYSDFIIEGIFCFEPLFLRLINWIIGFEKNDYEEEEDFVIDEFTEFCEVTSDQGVVLEDSEYVACQEPCLAIVQIVLKNVRE